MTVSELIQQLQKAPPDALVVTEGYEDGYDTVKKVSLIAIEENEQPVWYVGKYTASNQPGAQQAVLLYAGTKDENK